ncbi:MAG: hypothetical protein FWF50_04985 [Defluviitaleaceae bacterium]|nr:hypothetical protein [Defluviitaleaceae bacterium]
MEEEKNLQASESVEPIDPPKDTEVIEEQILAEAEKLKIEDDRIKEENREIAKQKALEQYYRDKYIDRIHVFIAIVGGLLAWVIIYASGNLSINEMLFRMVVVIAVFYGIGLWFRAYIKKRFLISEEELLAYLGFEERALEYERMQQKEEELRKLQEEKLILEKKIRDQEKEAKAASEAGLDLNRAEPIFTEEDIINSFNITPNNEEEPDFSISSDLEAEYTDEEGYKG